MTGRKRQILVDTLGLLLKVAVHPADIQDRDGGMLVLEAIPEQFPTIARVWADGGYAGGLVDWVAEELGRALEIVRPPAGQRGVAVQPRRWVVERTFAWVGRNRRLSRDVERDEATTEALFYLASCHLLLKRLKPAPT